ncbi:MAG: sugar nucleotidyltransferase [Armatimonadetes bacterium]|nr:sugar nucleotidyltransferase [Armatimonadota bacterium]
MKGVILAAGKGSRLHPVTLHVPKPLLPLANRPTIHYAFDRLKEIGVTDLCVVVGANEPEMRAALGDGSDLGISLSYAVQSDAKGLAHAVSFAKGFVGKEDFVLYLGDAVYSEGFAHLRNRFEQSRCANLDMVKEVADPSRFGVADVVGERIVKLVEKPAEPESNLAMAGVYFFTSRIWDTLPGLKPSARGEYEITDAIQTLVQWGEPVLAGLYRGRWFDTGTLDSFLACSSFLLGGGALVGKGAVVEARIGRSVCVGEGALVRCGTIEDTVVLPGSRVEVAGDVKHCLIGGYAADGSSLKGRIVYAEAI